MRALLLLICLPFPLSAADNDWANLDRLKSGDEIDVVQTSMGTTTGTYRSHSAEALVMDAGGAAKSFPRSAVARVSRKGHAHRIRNAAILGAVGAVVGAGAMRFGIACAETNDGCRNTKLATFFGGVGGAVAGALIPVRAELIYRGKKN
jgi:hypothetical protein